MQIERENIKELALGKISLLKALSQPERAVLLKKLTLHDYKKGANIIISDQSGREMMFVADGIVDIKRTNSDGKEVIISRLGVGDFFGEISLLTGSSRSADVVAVEDCMILVLSSRDFDQLLNDNPNFSRALLVDLARRVSAASTRISDLALLDVYLRVESTLKSLAIREPETAKLVVLTRPTHKDLAAMVGSSREMVTRAISRLEEDGAIKIEGQKIWLL